MTFDCVACGDTGRNSKGGPCSPCTTQGRQPVRDAILGGIDTLFADGHEPTAERVVELVQWAFLPRYTYAAGFRDKDGGMAMFDGPTPDLSTLLDRAPRTRALPQFAYIIEITRAKHWGEEDTHRPVARWRDGRWQRKRRPDA